MKRLITIILALIIALFTAPQKGADQPSVTAVKTPQTAIVTRTEQVPEESETTTETAFVSEAKATETVKNAASEEEPTIQEAVTEKSTEIIEETFVTEPEKIPSNASMRVIKALRNTSLRLAVSRIPSRMTHRLR